MSQIIAVDSETVYTSDYSIRTLGNYAYTHHELFNCYLVTAAFEDKRPTFCGPPEAFDWGLLDGNEIVTANAGFDLAVISRLQELGKIPNNFTPAEVHDVLDLSRYLSFPGNLAGASEFLLNTKADKGVRDKAKGLRWENMTPEFQAAMKVYATTDAELTLRLWLEHGHKLPPEERELSRLTREMCSAGLYIDTTGLGKSITHLETLIVKTRAKIPWGGEEGVPMLSKKKLKEEAAKLGIKTTKSMAKTDLEFQQWLRDHGDALPCAQAMSDYRRINIFLKKLQAMQAQTRPDGTMPLGIKFHSAHTGRDGGGSGSFNWQNLTKEEHFGVNIRELIIAPPGKILGVIDLAQIEARCALWLAGDTKTLDLVRGGMNLYEAHARQTMGYKSEGLLATTDKKLYALAKARVLALGFGCGPEKFQTMAKTLAGLDVTFPEAEHIVAEYRRSNPLIKKTWDKLDAGLRQSAGGDFTVTAPNGSELHYRGIKTYGSTSGILPRNGKMMRVKLYGAMIYENITQKFARDIFMTAVLHATEGGYPARLRCHDEAVFIFDESTAEADLTKVQKIFGTAPEWCADLPISSEGFLTPKYCK